MKTMQKFLWALAILGFLAGCYGLYDRLVNGHLNVNYGTYVPWGLWVAGYTYLIGLSAGAFLISALVFVFGVTRLARAAKLGLFTALIALGAALLTIWLDLGHPERFLRLFIATNLGSVMGAMAWLYILYGLLVAVMLWFALRADLVAWSARSDFPGRLARFLLFGRKDISAAAQARDRRTLQILGIVGTILAIAFPGGGGALFGVVAAHPYWNAALTPILFIAGALLSGAGLMAFVALVFDADSERSGREAVSLLGRIVLGLLAVYVVLEWAEYSIGLYAAVPAEAAGFRLALVGPYAWVFWGVHVLLGVVVPALILILRGRSPLAVGLAGLLVAATFLSVRLNIVLPGLAVPVLPGLAEAFAGPGLSFDYMPTLTEWLVQVWIVSTALLAFLLGFRWLPLGPIQAASPAASPQPLGAPAPASE